jgi:hypothetical protein
LIGFLDASRRQGLLPSAALIGTGAPALCLVRHCTGDEHQLREYSNLIVVAAHAHRLQLAQDFTGHGSEVKPALQFNAGESSGLCAGGRLVEGVQIVATVFQGLGDRFAGATAPGRVRAEGRHDEGAAFRARTSARADGGVTVSLDGRVVPRLEFRDLGPTGRVLRFRTIDL